LKFSYTTEEHHSPAKLLTHSEFDPNYSHWNLSRYLINRFYYPILKINGLERWDFNPPSARVHESSRWFTNGGHALQPSIDAAGRAALDRLLAYCSTSSSAAAVFCTVS
jgi:hypothetical protein